MIRSVLAIFVFAVALCTFIVLRPDSRSSPVEAEVTRAETDELFTGTTMVPEMGVAPSASERIVQIRNEPQIRTTETDMQGVTNTVLTGLGITEAAPAQAGSDDMRSLTDGILNDISQVTGGSAQGAGTGQTLEALVIQSLRDGQSDAYIDALLNEAASSGQVAVPEILVTEDGRVDTRVLLENIVNQAARSAAGDTAPPARPDVPLGSADGVGVRMVQTASETVQYRFYTVQRGDSLGAIAIKFYGDVSYYPAIFDANRGRLSSPDEIRSGQRLVIPEI